MKLAEIKTNTLKGDQSVTLNDHCIVQLINIG